MCRENTICFFCGSNMLNFHYLQSNLKSNLPYYVINCPVCGEYVVDIDYKEYFSNLRDETAFYLYFYNKLNIDGKKHKTCIINDLKENKDKEDLNYYGFDIIDVKSIKEYYPYKTDKKIDLLAYALVKKSGQIDQIPAITIEEVASAASIKRNFNGSILDYDDALNQVLNPLNYLKNKGFISNKIFEIKANRVIENIHITTECHIYVENKVFKDLKDNKKNIFIALEFSNNTDTIKEAIKDGIKNAGYEPIIMNELIFGEQIVPEIYKNINDSKMLIMDTTYENYGAYYEAGYAQGLNKKVIVTCKKYKFDNEGVHFDISQKQCLLWLDEKDLTKQLTQWIKTLE